MLFSSIILKQGITFYLACHFGVIWMLTRLWQIFICYTTGDDEDDENIDIGDMNVDDCFDDSDDGKDNYDNADQYFAPVNGSTANVAIAALKEFLTSVLIFESYARVPSCMVV